MKDLHHSCQGESHIHINKVCQDSSYSSTSDSMSIAIVCDGHGGARYFRSDVGSRLAVEATIECIQAFVSEIDSNLFKGKTFTQKKALSSEASSSIYTKDTNVDKALRQLFSSIIYNWRGKITSHSQNAPITEEERNTIKPDYLADFEQGVGIEKTYGCTLMCYVYTEPFWFAFHIGDGKCIAFDENGSWLEPIPWDEKCFLNKTTSLCDSSAIEEFRYCYCGDGTKPLAVFLGSDGIDDSFGATENMVNFYVQVLKLINKEGQDKALVNIQETLPQLSKIGSKDDMSITCVYDEDALSKKVMVLVGWQRRNIEKQLFDVNNRILKYKEEITRLGNCDLRNQKLMIDFQYAKKDLSKAFEQKHSLANKWNKFSEEIDGESFIPYQDEIGWEDSYAEEMISTDDNSSTTDSEVQEEQTSNEADVNKDTASEEISNDENHAPTDSETDVHATDAAEDNDVTGVSDTEEQDNNNIASEE
jgi:hypothetical protein